MLKLVFGIATYLLLLGSLLSAKQTPVDIYACVAQRVVGIQGDGDIGARVHGRINLGDSERAFLFTLVELDEDSRPATCLLPEKARDNFLFNHFQCDMSIEMTFSKGKNQPVLRSADGFHFISSMLGHSFYFFGDFHYVFNYTNHIGDWYLEEGECQKK